MKVYIFRFKIRSAFLILIAALAAVISIIMATEQKVNIAEVFSTSRELPIYSVDCYEKKAAITFDCAWGADDIPDILNTLKKENIKATFFLVGQWAEKYPETVKMIFDDGHDIGNHSYSHFRMGTLGEEKIKEEIIKCSETIKNITGSSIDLFRAPYGDYNNTVIRTAKKLGYFTIQWDVDSLDWKPGISKEEIMTRINNKIQPGSIILFHNDTPQTAKILPEIINTLKGQGYSFEPVSNLIMRQNYSINHEGRQIREK